MTGRVAACILALPGPTGQAWRDRLVDAASEQGWDLIVYGGQALVGDLSRTVLLVSDVDHARHLGPARWVVLATALGEAARAAPTVYDLPPEQGLWVVSRLLATASTLPAVHWLEDSVLGLGTIDILPGLTVAPPRRERLDAIDESFVSALRVFEGGPPVPGRSAWWPCDLFGKDAGDRSTGDGFWRLDITGRSRILVFGPYISLPPGDWQARLRFWVDAPAARASWRIEWGDQTGFAFHSFQPGRAGRFEVRIVHRWETAAPAVMRLVLEVPAVDGTLGFEGLHVEQVG